MAGNYTSSKTKGTRLQAGIAKGYKRFGPPQANGLLMRGVVLVTYVTDTPGHPKEGDTASPPTAVYCDVLVYGSIPGNRWFGMKNVLVSQSRGGMHRGDIWKPRAAKANLTSDTLEASITSNNPAFLDGDHVLIGFLNDSFDQPIILRGLPHPTLDVGNEDYNLGQRMKLVVADGDPEIWKHHGVHWGVDDSGNYTVDSRFANDGKLADAAGKEAAPPTDGKGTQTHNLPKDATYDVVLYDMSSPASPSEVTRITLNENKLNIEMAGKVVKSVAIADYLQVLYVAAKTAFDNHTHSTGTGPSGPPAPTPTFPAWDTKINSQKLTVSEN